MDRSEPFFFRKEQDHSRGRPSDKAGPPMALRLYPDIAEALDAWIAEQPDPKPNRPEAIRELLRIVLGLLPPSAQVHLPETMHVERLGDDGSP